MLVDSEQGRLLVKATQMTSSLKVQFLTRPAIFRTGKELGFRQARFYKSKCGGRVIRAAVNRSDQNSATAETVATETLDSKELNGSLMVSSSSVHEDKVIDVRAVITVRKKSKERLVDKIEDQWERFINGIGQGISLRLISEEIDPGLSFVS